MAITIQIILLEAEFQSLRKLAARNKSAPANYLQDFVRQYLKDADQPIDATDKARELAEEHGLDLAHIEGSGAGGRVLASDVVKAVEERE